MGEGGRGLGETCEDVVWKDLEVSQGMRRKRGIPGGGNHGYPHRLPGPQRETRGRAVWVRWQAGRSHVVTAGVAAFRVRCPSQVQGESLG